MSETRDKVDESPSPILLNPPHPQTSSGSRAVPKGKTAGAIDIASLIVMIVVLLAIGVAAFFVYRGSTLKSQLAQARNEVREQRTQMQHLVDDSKTKARQSADELAALQSQVALAKTEMATAKSNTEKAASQLAELQSQLRQARRQADEAKKNSEKLSAELAKLKEQFQVQVQPETPAPQTPAPETPAQAEQPAPVVPAADDGKPLPVSATFKKAPMLDGIALALQNTSTETLPLTVRFSNRSGSKSYEVRLEPRAVKEVGWLGDWVLAPGDKVVVRGPGYEPIVKTAP